MFATHEAKVIVRQLALLMAKPGNFEQAQLHEVVEVSAHLLALLSRREGQADRRQGGIVHDHLAELQLEFDELREIRHVLRGPPAPGTDCPSLDRAGAASFPAAS